MKAKYPKKDGKKLKYFVKLPDRFFNVLLNAELDSAHYLREPNFFG